MEAIKCENTGIWEIRGLEPWEETFTGIVENLKVGKMFKFARYGDGEIYCMKGRQGGNCDNHSYFPDLGSALRQTVSSEPEYMVGIQPMSVSNMPDQVQNYFGHFKTLYNADVLHNASISGRLEEFTRALDGRYVVLVGPPHLADLFTNCVHIVTPSINCWLQFENVRQQLEFHVEGINNAVVLLAASMMSEVLISEFEDYHHTFIDAGSVFDPYCGVKSRRYHYKLKI